MNKCLKAMSLQIAGGLGLSAFGASEGWLSRWKQRFGVGYRCFTITAQKVTKDYEEKLLQFRKAIITMQKQKAFHHHNKIDRKTIRGKTTKAEKKGFTVALAATASGVKLPSVIIFKEKNGVLGKQAKAKPTIPDNVRVQATTNGWMTRKEYHHWLTHTYKSEDES